MFGATRGPERAGTGLCGLGRPGAGEEEWLRYQLQSRHAGGLLGGSRVFQYLTAAAPGMTELVTIGQGLGARPARAPHRRPGVRPRDRRRARHRPRRSRCCARRARSRASPRVGPIARQAGDDRRVPARPAPHRRGGRGAAEEMPVNETLELERALRRRAGHGRRRDRGERASTRSASAPRRRAAHRGARRRAARRRRAAALRAALSEHTRARGRARPAAPPEARGRRARSRTLPFLFEPELGREHVERLSARAGAAGCDRATGSSARRSASARARAASARRPPRRRSRSAWPRAARRSPC